MIDRLTAVQDVPAAQAAARALADGVEKEDPVPQHVPRIEMQPHHPAFVRPSHAFRHISAKRGQRGRFRVQHEQLVAPHGLQIEPPVRADVPGVELIAHEGIGVARQREMQPQLFDLPGVGVDPKQPSAAAGRIDVPVRADAEAVRPELRRLPQIRHCVFADVVSVDVPAHHPAEIEHVVPPIQRPAVDRFARDGDAAILQHAGIGIVQQQVGAGESFPQMLIVALQHPRRMLRCLRGGVGGHHDPPVVHEGHRRVDLAGADLALLHDQAILQCEVAPERVLPRQVFVQPHIPALGQLRAQAEEHPPVRRYRHIPDRVVAGVARPVDQAVAHRFRRESAEKRRIALVDRDHPVGRMVAHHGVLLASVQPAAMRISCRRASVSLVWSRTKLSPERTRPSTICRVLAAFFFAARHSSS